MYEVSPTSSGDVPYDMETFSEKRRELEKEGQKKLIPSQQYNGRWDQLCCRGFDLLDVLGILCSLLSGLVLRNLPLLGHRVTHDVPQKVPLADKVLSGSDRDS